MSKTKTPNIKSTSVPSEYDTPMTTLEFLRKVQEQNAQVLARQDEIEEALNDRVAKSGDTMTGALNTPQVNAGTGVLRHMSVVSQDGNTHVEANNNGFVAEVSVPDLNKKYTFGVGSNGKVALNVHDVPNDRDILFMFPNADDYEKGTYELSTFTPKVYDCEAMPEDTSEISWVKRCKLIQLAPHVFAIDVLFDCTEGSGSKYIDVFTDKITGNVDAIIAYDEHIGVMGTSPCQVTKITNGIRLEMDSTPDPSNVYLHGIFTEGE